jgi:hypothetical protein
MSVTYSLRRRQIFLSCSAKPGLQDDKGIPGIVISCAVVFPAVQGPYKCRSGNCDAEGGR